MADRTGQISLLPGIGAAGAIAALILGTLLIVALRAEGFGQIGAQEWGAVRFTLTQALVSAGLSCALAIPVARALARRAFWGRSALISLLGAPFLLPVVVAVMGLLAVFGRSGWVAQAFGILGLPPLSIYGFHGVVLAHVFFNLPLATRILLQGWLSIPSERFRLAAQLGFSTGDVQRHLEWPMLRRSVPGAFAIIFAICVSSFAVALTLGGGPRATTVELAIYQAFRFDFDLAKAALLSVIQLGLAGNAAFLALRISQGAEGFGAGLDRAALRWDARGTISRIGDALVLVMASAFLLIPLSAVVIKGATGIAELPATVWQAAGLSLQVALGSTLLTLLFAFSISLATLRLPWLEMIGILALAASPLVIGTGLFLIIFPVAAPQDWAMTVTALVNSIMALPFALRVLGPAVQDAATSFGPLAASLGLGKWGTLRLVIVPRVRAPLGFAAGLAAALSMGDLGVVALFASVEQATLPLQIYRLMGAYKMEAAASASVLLAVLSFGLFWLCDTWGRRDA